eukprot:Nitzschia sp. Nitz4//scaffold75_size92586//38763//39896//NITZ4_004852-RA/size92586-exonerate_est2genome-gene-0.72-mRNA-1//-1//CDS//3329557696//7494//frame0
MIFSRMAVAAMAALFISNQQEVQAGSFLRRSLSQSVGDRVSEFDGLEAECNAAGNGATGTVAWTEINYYYSIHSSAALTSDVEAELESYLYAFIQSAILWCTLPENNQIERKMSEALRSKEFLHFRESKRRLMRQDNRHLSIISFNNNPRDQDIGSYFDETTSPCQFSESVECTMMEGIMGISAHSEDNLSLVVASVLDAVQETMDGDLLISPLCAGGSQCLVEKVEFWGDSLQDVTDAVEGLLNPSEDDDDGSGGNVVVTPGDDDETNGYTTEPTTSPSLYPTDENGNPIITPGGDDDDDSTGGNTDDNTNGNNDDDESGGSDDDETNGNVGGSTASPSQYPTDENGNPIINPGG